jgi:hypothetical protein
VLFAVVLAVSGVTAVGSFGAALSAAASPPDSPNWQAARADVTSLIAGLPLPAGAMPAAGEPAGDDRVLFCGKALWFLPSGADVDEHAFWTVAASPASVLASVNASPPYAGLAPYIPGGAPPCPGSYQEEIDLPSITNVVAMRSVFVEATVLADGMTGVRADVADVAITPRGTRERIPLGAKRLLVTTTPPTGGKRTVLASVTSRTKIHQVAELLNGLPLQPMTVTALCGYNNPLRPQVQLAFYSRRGARLAVASFRAWPVTSTIDSQCGVPSIDMTINGRSKASLLSLWYPSSGLSQFPPLLTGLDAALNINIPTSI